VLEEEVVSATKATLFSQVCLRKTCTTEARRRTYNLSFFFLYFLFYFIFVLEGNKLEGLKLGRTYSLSFFSLYFYFYLFIVLEGNKFFLGSFKVSGKFSSIGSNGGPRLKNLRFSNSFRIWGDLSPTLFPSTAAHADKRDKLKIYFDIFCFAV
jgi:hypothetical protein